jgi:hypothetical protein
VIVVAVDVKRVAVESVVMTVEAVAAIVVVAVVSVVGNSKKFINET